MADEQRNSNQPRYPARSSRSSTIGRARQRQLERQQTSEGFRTRGQAALQKVQSTSLILSAEKLADLNPTPRRAQRPSQRSSAGSVYDPEVGSRSTPIGRRRPVHQAGPGQRVAAVPVQRSASSSSRSLLGDHRQRRVVNTTQGKMPPVLVRGSTTDMAVRRTKTNQPKRRYDVALDVPGAELQLPSLPMIRFGWRAVSGMIAAMMIACLFILWKTPAFQVNLVEAEGLARLTVGDLNGVMDVLGNSIFSLDPRVVEQKLSQSFPELADISIRMGLPAHVVVRVTERQPVLSWYQDSAEVWVDADGVAFWPRGDPGSLVRVEGQGEPPAAIAGVAVPAVSSLPGGAVAMPSKVGDETVEQAEPARLPVDLVQAILTLGSQVPTDTQLVYDSKYGLGWEDPLGWEVYFGTQTSDMQQRLIVYQGVVEYLTGHGLQPELVSVEFVHAPYYRMER